MDSFLNVCERGKIFSSLKIFKERKSILFLLLKIFSWKLIYTKLDNFELSMLNLLTAGLRTKFNPFLIKNSLIRGRSPSLTGF